MNNKPDIFFTLAQQERLGLLMAKWREARDANFELGEKDQTELEELIDVELIAAGQRADAIADLCFSERDHGRMAELARKSNEGLLTIEERREFENYVIAGDIISTFKSKVRLLRRNERILQTPSL